MKMGKMGIGLILLETISLRPRVLHIQGQFMTQSAAASPQPALLSQPGLVPGLVLTFALAAGSTGLAKLPWLSSAGLSVLTLAIILGMLVGNTIFPSFADRADAGVDFSKNILLRTGIVFFGFRITFQDIAQVGWAGVVIAALIVGGTFLLAVVLGTRVFRLDKHTAMLIGAGSAICGAAAVMATEPVVKGKPQQVTVAVATVVIFGTLAMFAYPFLFSLSGLDDLAFGVYIGSTVHEVAQVVAAGAAVSEHVAATAVIEKMIRVMMLAPFLLVLSVIVSRNQSTASNRRIVIPWFAVLFIVAAGVNSSNILPASLVEGILHIDMMLLAMAMAALGLRTRFASLRQAGLRPILLAATLFAFLVVGGLGINVAVSSLLA